MYHVNSLVSVVVCLQMMAGETRFATLTSEELQAILKNRDSSNTKQCIESAKRVFITYCTEKGLLVDNILPKTKGEIAEILINFYAELRRKDSELYSGSSMISIRFGLQRFFQNIKNDIINDADFRLSNEMFKTVLINIKRTGKGTTQHKDVISDADMATFIAAAS